MTGKPSTSRWTAIAGLTLACATWGYSFPMLQRAERIAREVLGGSEYAAGTWVVAARFLLAFAVLLPLPRVRAALRKRGLMRDAFWFALPSAIASVLQTAAMRGVEPGANAFLTSLYTPLTPLFAWFLFRRRPPMRVLMVLPIAGVGAWLTTDPGGEIDVHEVIVAVAAIGWVFQILLLDRFAPRHDPVEFAAGYCLWAGVLGIVALLGFSPSPTAWADPLLEWEMLEPLIGLALLSTVLTMILLARFQPRLDPSRAALLYVLEPAFAAMFSWTIVGETFEGWKLVGCLILFGSNVIVEVWPRKRQPG